ncbi:MAG: hypothetical protein WCT40_03720 [Candidatus Magasanikbacteria bacterium]
MMEEKMPKRLIDVPSGMVFLIDWFVNGKLYIREKNCTVREVIWCPDRNVWTKGEKMDLGRSESVRVTETDLSNYPFEG